MTKSEHKQITKLMQYAQFGIANNELHLIGVAARGISALIRASKDSNTLITIAAGIPAIVQHADFIV